MKRIGRGLAWAVFLILLGALGYLAWYSPGRTAPIVDPNGAPLPNAIAVLEEVPINGTRQWLLIRGQDRRKPVLLFLHGGPGLPEAALLVGHPLEKEFVVVNWEQRGAGKSYDAEVFNDSFTVETFVNDAAAVSQYLSQRFHQPRIYLMAHSWGTFLGALTVHRHPEQFLAFFSISQIADQLEAEQLSYDWVRQQARRHANTRALRKLEKQGRPPYPPEAWLDYLMWQRELVAEYGGGMYKGNFYPLFIQKLLHCREYTLLDKARYAFGAMRSTERLWPAVVATNLIREVPRLEVPYYVFQGIHDYQTPYPIARRYVEQVAAPRKRLFTFTRSAHSPFLEEPKRFWACLDSARADLVLRDATASILPKPLGRVSAAHPGRGVHRGTGPARYPNSIVQR